MKMLRGVLIVLACAGLAGVGAAQAGALSVTLTPVAGNPPSPQMGDRLAFHSVIRNDAAVPVTGIIAWISLVQVDPGLEQPVDLEDWSAHKAVTVGTLAPGQAIVTDWPMRLIQSGHYRVVISAVNREAAGLTASPFVEFAVRRKPVVESQRVLPVAIGIPLGIVGLMLWRRRRA